MLHSHRKTILEFSAPPQSAFCDGAVPVFLLTVQGRAVTCQVLALHSHSSLSQVAPAVDPSGEEWVLYLESLDLVLESHSLGSFRLEDLGVESSPFLYVVEHSLFLCNENSLSQLLLSIS